MIKELRKEGKVCTWQSGHCFEKVIVLGADEDGVYKDLRNFIQECDRCEVGYEIAPMMRKFFNSRDSWQTVRPSKFEAMLKQLEEEGVISIERTKSPYAGWDRKVKKPKTFEGQRYRAP